MGIVWEVNVRKWPSYLKNEPIYDCFLAKLYCVWDVRNAWYGESSEGSALHHNEHDARWYVEPLRKQGTRWNICEVPTIVFRGNEHSALIAVVPFHLSDGTWRILCEVRFFLQATNIGVLLASKRKPLEPGRGPKAES